MENNWSKKSRMFIEGAELLYSNEIYCTVIHSSYYSNILLMFNVLSVYLKKSDAQIETERSDGSRTSKGTHNWLKSIIASELHKLSDITALRTFNNSFGILKELRIKADYKNTEIFKEKAHDSIGKAKKINEILERKFNL